LIPYDKNSLPKQIPSLPYFAVTWQSFLDFKDISKEVKLTDNIPEEQLFLVEPYS
jgi:hypothetical protein